MRDAAQLGQKAVRDKYFCDSVSFDLFNCEQNWPIVCSTAQISLHIYLGSYIVP